jgi:acyl carrier protein
MTREQVRQAALEAFQLEIGRSAESIDPARDLRQQVHLDSMQFVAFIARLEVLLGVELPIEAMTVDTLNEFLDVVSAHINGSKAA